MTVVTGTGTREPAIVRFDRVERMVHWATATAFLILMLTGAMLYAGPFSALVGRRSLVRTIHVTAGLALPVPFLVALVASAGARLRRDVTSLNRWQRGDGTWLRRRGKGEVVGKFNAGQKLNATFLAGAAVVMLMTGVMMKWFSLVSLDWRTGATFVHDWFALGIWFSVGGHVMFATADPIALRSMWQGTVTAHWARTKRPRWYEEETGQPAQRFGQSTPGS